jgi:hypothetical protein
MRSYFIFIFFVLVKSTGFAQINTLRQQFDTITVKGLYVLNETYNPKIKREIGGVSLQIDETIHHPKFYLTGELTSNIFKDNSYILYFSNCDESPLISLFNDTSIFQTIFEECDLFEKTFLRPHGFNLKGNWYKVYETKMVCIIKKVSTKNAYLLNNPAFVVDANQGEFLLIYPYRILSMKKVTKKRFKKYNISLKII